MGDEQVQTQTTQKKLFYKIRLRKKLKMKKNLLFSHKLSNVSEPVCYKIVDPIIVVSLCISPNLQFFIVYVQTNVYLRNMHSNKTLVFKKKKKKKKKKVLCVDTEG